MTTTAHSTLIGNFIVKEDQIIDFSLFSSLKEYNDKDKSQKKICKKHKLKSFDNKPSQKLLSLLKDQKYFQTFRNQNLLQTKEDIKNSVNEDDIIIQTVNNMNELDVIANTLAKRLREWFSLTLPELDKEIFNHKVYAELVSTKSRKDLLKKLKIKDSETMGSNISDVNYQQIQELAKRVTELYSLRDSHEEYVEKILKEYCPNFHAIAGTNIAAKLFEHGKSLKRLACLPASTIQLFGAEKALFRHIKTGSKSPKYGILYTHYLVQKSKRRDKGMVARSLAAKLSLALRIDYFKGDFKGDSMRKELEKKFGISPNPTNSKE